MFAAETSTPVLASLEISDEIGAARDLAATRTLAAARQRMHQNDCDPRDPSLFLGIDVSLISDLKLGELRDLICGALSVRDQRPWSSNGKRISVNNMTTFLGTIFNSLFLVIISTSTNFDLIGFSPLFSISRTLFSKRPTGQQGRRKEF